jgi:hypothetical protein
MIPSVRCEKQLCYFRIVIVDPTCRLDGPTARPASRAATSLARLGLLSLHPAMFHLSSSSYIIFHHQAKHQAIFHQKEAL